MFVDRNKIGATGWFAGAKPGVDRAQPDSVAPQPCSSERDVRPETQDGRKDSDKE